MSKNTNRGGALLLTLSMLAAGSPAAFGQAFTYDALDRLTGARYGTTPAVSYAYDLVGNITNWNRTNASAETDTDVDALPDAWEYVWFDHLTNSGTGDFNQDTISNLRHFQEATDPTEPDTDHDGLQNSAELQAGTSPTNPLSCLQMEQIRQTNSAGMLVRWQSATGKFYRLQRTTNLTQAGAFVNLRTNIPATPILNTYTDSTAVGAGPWSYRIQLE